MVFTFAQAPAWLKLDYHSGLIQGRTPDTTGSFAVVFGGGTPSGAFTFSAGGRIGDGLDTLAQLTYDLPRDPVQSIVDRGQTLHTAWPGRMPFSPGTARPLLHSLRPLQHKINLVQGEKRHLRLIGQYTDGYEYRIGHHL